MFPAILLGIPHIFTGAVIGLIGRGGKFGAWGYFSYGILLTPVISLLLVLAPDRRPAVQ